MKRKKMEAANSVGAETESMKMKRRIISPERTKIAREVHIKLRRRIRENRIRTEKPQKAAKKDNTGISQVAGKI